MMAYNMIQISHWHMSVLKKLMAILETVQKNYPSYELIEFIPLDGQAKENSKLAAVDYQPADDIVKKICTSLLCLQKFFW